jgi:hypothetical protein
VSPGCHTAFGLANLSNRGYAAARVADERLPDEAYVVRGGLMESSTMLTNAEVHNLEHPGEWAISVACLLDTPPGTIGERSPYPGRWMRVSTVGAIRSIGHDVVRAGREPHANLVLGCEPSEEVWDQLRSVFDAPAEKPPHRKEDA